MNFKNSIISLFFPLNSQNKNDTTGKKKQKYANGNMNLSVLIHALNLARLVYKR
jgi:hypothetical protein